MTPAFLRPFATLCTLVLLAALAPLQALAAPPPPSGDGSSVTAQHRVLERVSALPGSEGAIAAQTTGRAISLTEVTVGADPAVVGMTWPESAADSVAMYRDLTSGEPTAWTSLELEGDATAGKVGTEPIIVDAKSTLQFALLSDGPVEATASVYSSAADGSATQDRVAAASFTSSPYDHVRPAIRSRAQWGANEAIVGLPYVEGIVTGAMIHHTAGTNSYTASEVPGLLRSIQAFHVYGRGWKDIAYNILVDKFGTAWEGRGGGLDRAIAGGHAYGLTNNRVFGVSLMGNYDTTRPSAAMIDTTQRVIAWKFLLHGVDPYGATFGSGGQDGGSTWLPAISGHRDENSTACPGRYVYELMPQIRASVKGLLNDVSSTFYVNDAFTGVANTMFIYGEAGKEFYFGDWDGDGIDTPMVRNGNQFLIRDTNTSGRADRTIAFGDPGDTVIVGDWDGDGTDTLMIRRGYRYFVKNTIDSGFADYVFGYGNPDDVVLAGDWNGDGKDTLTVRRGYRYFVKNTTSSGVADYVFGYGNPDDVVLVGDWNGDELDTLAVRRGNQYLLKNDTETGIADTTFRYGETTDEAFVGNFNGDNGDNGDTIGIRR